MAIEKFKPDLIVLDDAFQHRHVARDCDIVLVDANCPIRKEWLLPAGNRREPLSALKRANIIIYTKTDKLENIDPFNLRAISEAEILNMQFKPVHYRDFFSGEKVEISKLTGTPVLAFTGIAAPENFRKMLLENGLTINYFLVFPDHHRYQPQDIKTLCHKATETDSAYLITTAKDVVKLNSDELRGQKVFILEVRPVFPKGSDPGQKVQEYIDKRVLSG